MDIVTVTEAQAKERLIRRSDLVASKLAFIDCKIPGSHLKENYAIIGPGVSQDASQVIPLAEPHGFQIGAAVMPNGITSNLHIHFTAEVFIIFRGKWLFRWGADGKDGEIVGEAGDVVSVPTTAGSTLRWAATTSAGSSGIPPSWTWRGSTACI